jgi:wobble nucleotide-excising tRNase
MPLDGDTALINHFSFCRVEKKVKEVEADIERERHAVDAVVNEVRDFSPKLSHFPPLPNPLSTVPPHSNNALQMNRHQREAYMKMKKRSDQLSKEIEEKQSSLEALTQAVEALQREVDTNPIKREAGVWKWWGSCALPC